MRRGCVDCRYGVASALLDDPLGFDAGDSNLYRYVNNAPTNAADPSGLEPEPLAAPIGNWKVVPGKSGEKSGAKGKFFWQIETDDKQSSSVRAEFWFKPDKANTSKNILFLQCIMESTVGGKAIFGNPTATEEMVNNAKAMTSDLKLGSRPDIAPLRNTRNFLYRQPLFNDKDKLWRYDGLPATREGVGDGPNQKNAYENDISSANSWARKGMGDVIKRYEIAVISADTWEVLAVLKWGYRIDDKQGSKVIILGGGMDDFSLQVSPEFKKIVANANMIEGLKQKVEKPTKTDLGGTSALPD